MNSLLDGSMRCVGLARTSLQQNGAKTTAPSIDDGLGKAQAAMKHMAALLERAMRQATAESPAAGAAVTAMFDSRQTLQQVSADLADLLRPHAQLANATLQFDIGDDCADLPASSLGPVLMNGLRNALQACEARSDTSPATVATVIKRDNWALNIAISGPTASKPAGHRIGLSLSSQIVNELEGELGLLASGDVATLRVCVPIANLQSHA
ncbi:MAG TPA: hypothetical protein VMS30_08100 [Phycisphaerales bacterium]|nr:hypothetical protein [Phycisphaerales bacterium]